MMPLATLTEPFLAAIDPGSFLAAFDVLDHVRHWMHHAGYPMLFGLLLSCGLGLPLPEDIPLLLAGFFVAKGEMSLVPAAICAWCGIIGGDCVLYAIGRRFGLGITAVPVIGRHIKVEQIGKLHVQFERYGVWVVAVGRMFAGVRGAMVLVAGTIRFTFVHFIVADGLAAIVSGGLFMGLGYYAGRRFGDLKQIHTAIEQYSLWVLLGLVAAGVAFGGWAYWRRRGKRRRGLDVVPADRTLDARPAVDAVPPVAPPPVTATAAEAPALPPA